MSVNGYLRKEPMKIELPTALEIHASGVKIGTITKRDEETSTGYAFDVVVNQRVDIEAVADIVRKHVMRTVGRSMTDFLFDPNNGMFEVYIEKEKATVK